MSRWFKYYGKYENWEWETRTNRELEEMSKGENIVKWIKGQRISWLGHLERMEEDRMPKTFFTQELEGTRRWGRPRKRWKEEVERDLEVLGVRRWRELVADLSDVICQKTIILTMKFFSVCFTSYIMLKLLICKYLQTGVQITLVPVLVFS